MKIGNQSIGKEQMPSFVSPEQQPYHMYQSMQDMLNARLGTVPPVANGKAVGTVASAAINEGERWQK